MAKTTFFKKTLKKLARFSPRRVVYALGAGFNVAVWNAKG